MAMTEEQALAWSRQIVLDVLEGRISRKATPLHYADDDAPHMATRYLENKDPEWLLERLERPEYTLEGKLEIAVNLRELADKGRALLGFEGTADEFLLYAIDILGMPDI
jgi:hypothetical protein